MKSTIYNKRTNEELLTYNHTRFVSFNEAKIVVKNALDTITEQYNIPVCAVIKSKDKSETVYPSNANCYRY